MQTKNPKTKTNKPNSQKEKKTRHEISENSSRRPVNLAYIITALGLLRKTIKADFACKKQRKYFQINKNKKQSPRSLLPSDSHYQIISDRNSTKTEIEISVNQN